MSNPCRVSAPHSFPPFLLPSLTSSLLPPSQPKRSVGTALAVVILRRGRLGTPGYRVSTAPMGCAARLGSLAAGCALPLVLRPLRPEPEPSCWTAKLGLEKRADPPSPVYELAGRHKQVQARSIPHGLPHWRGEWSLPQDPSYEDRHALLRGEPALGERGERRAERLTLGVGSRSCTMWMIGRPSGGMRSIPSRRSCWLKGILRVMGITETSRMVRHGFTRIETGSPASCVAERLLVAVLRVRRAGWDRKILQKAVDTCTNDSGRIEDCPVSVCVSR